jgi:Domain of unknown function (DUF4157)
MQPVPGHLRPSQVPVASSDVGSALASPSRPLDPQAVAALGPPVQSLLRRARRSSAPLAPARVPVGPRRDPEELRADEFARETGGPSAALNADERATLGTIRVHTGVEAAVAARALGARSFALGDRIVFGEGEYRPDRADGRALLAHELHHAVTGAAAATARRQPLSARDDELPPPVTVTWSTDRFQVSFERGREGSVSRLVFAVRYLGKAPTQRLSVSDATRRVGVMIAESQLNVRVVSSDAVSLTVDLYGDSRHLVRLVDHASLDTSPQRTGRRHDFQAVVDYAVQASGSFWVLDPAATEKQITDAPREERPDLPPVLYWVVKGGHDEYQGAIDGDGDGDKELELHMQATEYWPERDGQKDMLKTVRVDVIQRRTGTPHSLTFNCPQPRLPEEGSYAPHVTEVTDGFAPTRIDLVRHDGGCVLEIAPGRHTATQSRYRLSAAGQGGDVVFGPDPPKRKVAEATGHAAVGGIVTLDLALGAYSDPFRITLRRLVGRNAVFGLTAMSDGRPSGGGGAELTYAGALAASLVDTGLTSIGVDLDGDGRADLVLYDQLTAIKTNPGPAELPGRRHRVRITGSAIAGDQTFEFTYWQGGEGRGAEPRTDADREAARNADAAGILAVEVEGGGRAEQLDQVELQAMALRQRAIGDGALRQTTYDTLVALWQALIQARAERGATAKGQVSGATQSLAVAAGDAFAHEYRRELDPASFSQLLDVARLTGAIKGGMWAQVFNAGYPSVVADLETAIAGRMKDKFGKGGARDLTTVGRMRGELRALPDTAIRVAASYHPDHKFETKQGYVSAVPLQIYVWRDGDKWRLRDVTNPDKHWDYDARAKPDEKTPGISLFAELDDNEHYPPGIIYWAVPGAAQGQTPVNDGLSWEQGLTYLGLGVAVVGITLVTVGAGTQAAVYGAYALTGSALIGATAAGIDLVTHIERDNLDATTAILDLSQIAAGVAGGGALISGRIIVAAGTAPASARFAGAWARVATLARKAYVPLTIATEVADVSTVLVMAVDTATRIEQITHDPSIKPEDRTRAVLLLLSQAALLGGLSSLKLKGTISTGPGETLVITQSLEGVPVASRVVGRGTVIVDSQVAIWANREARVRAALAHGQTPAPADVLKPGEQAMLDRFRARGDADIRISDKTAAEAVTFLAPQHGFGVGAERAGTEYQAVLQKLTDFNVGGGNGIEDRSIVADAFYAVTEPGVTPKFVTGDERVFKRLYAIEQARPGSNLQPLDKLGKKLQVAMPGGFDVTIGTRTLRVVPL